MVWIMIENKNIETSSKEQPKKSKYTFSQIFDMVEKSKIKKQITKGDKKNGTL
jgi:hypothetical protein